MAETAEIRIEIDGKTKTYNFAGLTSAELFPVGSRTDGYLVDEPKPVRQVAELRLVFEGRAMEPITGPEAEKVADAMDACYLRRYLRRYPIVE